MKNKQKHGEKAFFVSSSNTPNLREKTIIIGMAYLFSGVNCIANRLVCTEGSVAQGSLLLGIMMLLMVPISVMDKKRENRGMLATICACLVHLAFSGLFAYLSAPWWIAVYAVEVAAIAVVVFISLKHPNNAQKLLRRLERKDRIWGRGLVFGGWVLVFACLWTGTVMTFGMHYWEKDISREEAVAAEATYQSCRKSYARSSLIILVRFSDLEQQDVDGSCASEALYQQIKSLEPGTRVSLLLHPNSATILEFRVGDTILLDFDSTIKALRREVTGFTVLGVFVYLCAFGICAGLLAPSGVGRKLRVICNVGLSKGKSNSKALQRILRLYFKPLRQLLLAGVGFAVVVPLAMLLGGSQGWNVIWPPVLTLLVFCLTSLRVLIYRSRVWWELRTAKPQIRTICVRSIESDRNMRLLRYGEEGKAILTDDAGNAYRFVCAGVGGEGALAVGQKMQISFLPQTGFLLSVVPYLRKGEEKRLKKSLRSFFSLYFDGRYKYEKCP